MADAPRFRPEGQQDLARAGQAERARANLAALRVLREVQEAGRPATAEEQRVLARWSGWGALPLVFETRPTPAGFDSEVEYQRALDRWESLGDVRDRVRSLLSKDEWNAARTNTLNAHYTDAAFVQAIWGAVRAMGFDGGEVLEPGSGAGTFIGLAPDDLARPVRMTGVELEPNTAAISQLLYPDASIIPGALEKVQLPKNVFDAAVGNVPFGKIQPYDGEYNPDRALSIHDLFILKALASTRPGGVVALITSRFTLDASDSTARERLYELGDLVGAVRLPVGAHRAAAGTDVVTDVVFLRRRGENDPAGDDRWLGTVERTLEGRPEPVRVNAYYEAHPEHVLGRMQTRLGQYGPELTVVSEDKSSQAIAERLREASLDIAARVPQHDGSPSTAGEADERGDEPIVIAAERGVEGSLALTESGTITIVVGGRVRPLDVHPEQRDRLVQLIDLKQKVRALYDTEAATLTPGETPELAELRREVREAYQAYRKRYPPLSKPRQVRTFTPKEATERAKREGRSSVPTGWKQPTAFGLIDDDPEASLLFSLEVWDELTGKPVEQPILTRRMLEPRVLPDRADSAEEAIALALEHDGGVLDMARVAGLLGVDVDTAIERVGTLAFRNPYPEAPPSAQQWDGTEAGAFALLDAAAQSMLAGESSGAGLEGAQWEPRFQYLSGDVRTKLRQAREAAKLDPSYAANVAALEQVQPTDLTPSEIKARLGAPWIPVEDYTQFLRDLGFDNAQVRHAGGTVWEVRGADTGDLATSEWGTTDRSAQDLFETLLRQAESTIRITYRDTEGNTRVNQQATTAAREKAALLAQAFDDWVWRDTDRAERLARIYNERFNREVEAEYDTSPLTLPGAMLPWPLRPHQNAAVRRILNSPTTLLAHVVGAGKTATMVAAAMELRRTGLARKPAMVVPNHMLKQATRDFQQLYPNAKLLAINASDLHVGRRAKFMARIAGGDWDAVILTHEAFNRVPVRPATEETYLNAELAQLREQMERAKASGMSRRTVKQIETNLENAKQRITEQLDKTSEDGTFFEDTGIDYLFVDEAHEYKNLRTVSAIPGATIQGSNKASKLHMVLQHLRGNSSSGRVATLATGTPIANSVTEAYVLQRYLDPQTLEVMGVQTFDNWAATFGQVVTRIEPDPKGSGYRQKSRFARFFNVPELMRAYRSFADVQMAEDLDLPTPKVRLDTNGQRGEAILIPAAAGQRNFIKSLPHQPWINDDGGVLKALGLGLRASLDMRLVGGSEDQGSKIDHVAEQVAQIWAEHKDVRYPVSATDPTPQELPGALQLVFLDEGTPGSTSQNPVDLYDDLREKLAERGVPREQIRFVHEANNDLKKEKLFADARSGRVAVLIGSTQKMGTGTNVQTRAVALHHVSYPWRPADLAQRDGRIERQGNLNDEGIAGTPDDVRIIYYITERTYDEFRLNALTRKAQMIGQMQRRDFSVREIEDISDDALALGLLTALSSGDTTIMEHSEAIAERSRLQGLATNWDHEQDRRSWQINDADAFIEQATGALEMMRTASETRTSTVGDAFTITLNGTGYTKRETAATVLGRSLTELAKDTTLRPGQPVPLGRLGGQDFHAEIAYGVGGNRIVQLRFAWGHVVPPGHRSDRAQWQANKVTPETGRGALQALENFLNNLDSDIVKLDTAVQQQRQHRAEVASNLRDKAANPYRALARSKGREEHALAQLVIANEKEAALAERAAQAGDEVPESLSEELASTRAEVARLKDEVANEREQQRLHSEREAAPSVPASKPASPSAEHNTASSASGDRPDDRAPDREAAAPAQREQQTMPVQGAPSSIPEAAAGNGPAGDGEQVPTPSEPQAEAVPEQPPAAPSDIEEVTPEPDFPTSGDAPGPVAHQPTLGEPFPETPEPGGRDGEDTEDTAVADPPLPPGMTSQRRDELVEAMTMIAPTMERIGAGDPARYAVDALRSTLAPGDPPVTDEEWDWAEAWARLHPEIREGDLSGNIRFYEERRQRVKDIMQERADAAKQISRQASRAWRNGDLNQALELIGQGEELYPEQQHLWNRAHRAIEGGGGEPAPPEKPATPSTLETEPPGPSPDALPEAAQPVDGVDGYHYVSSPDINLTVYGPDGQVVGQLAGRFAETHAMVDGVRIPIGIRTENAPQIIARHHLASVDSSSADHVHLAWTTYKGERIVAVRGTIKGNEADNAPVRAARGMKWSSVQSAYITGTNWKPQTRDSKVAGILAAYARQGRNVRIVDEDAVTRSAPAESAVREQHLEPVPTAEQQGTVQQSGSADALEQQDGQEVPPQDVPAAERSTAEDSPEPAGAAASQPNEETPAAPSSSQVPEPTASPETPSLAPSVSQTDAAPRTEPQPTSPSTTASQDADVPASDGGPMPEQPSAVAEPASGPWAARIVIDTAPTRPTVSGTRFQDTELRQVLRDHRFRWRQARTLWEYSGPAAQKDDAVRAVQDKVAELDQAEAENISHEDAKPAKRTYPPTAQQQAIIDAVVVQKLDVAVQAYAGAGKTSTFELIANQIAAASPAAKIVYLAFNASIAKEARQKFGDNVTSLTAHSLALRSMRSTPFAEKVKRVGKGARHPDQIATLLDVRPVEYLGDEGEPQELAASARVQLAMAAVRKFRESADSEITPTHLPEALRQYPGTGPEVLATAQQIWQNITAPDNARLLDGDRPLAIVFDHDDYLKIWALGNPRIDADLIFFDEAQDINGVLRKLVQDQPIQKVVVGDTYQSIYGFRGAEDALADWPADVTLPLTQSWRFGPKIAERADDFLRLLGAPFELVGNPALDSTVGAVDTPDAVLCRTNVGTVGEVFRGFDEGKRVALVGGGNDIRKLARAAQDLMAGRGTKDPELSRFSNWAEVVEAAEEERNLQSFVRLIEQHGPAELLRMVENLTDENATGVNAPQLVVSTAHKAKGREWDRVRISGDFHTPQYNSRSGALESLPSREELRLSYVAITRGRHQVDPGSLAWIEDVIAALNDGQTIPGVEYQHLNNRSAAARRAQETDRPAAEPAPEAPEPVTEASNGPEESAPRSTDGSSISQQEEPQRAAPTPEPELEGGIPEPDQPIASVETDQPSVAPAAEEPTEAPAAQTQIGLFSEADFAAESFEPVTAPVPEPPAQLPAEASNEPTPAAEHAVTEANGPSAPSGTNDPHDVLVASADTARNAPSAPDPEPVAAAQEHEGSEPNAAQEASAQGSELEAPAVPEPDAVPLGSGAPSQPASANAAREREPQPPELEPGSPPPPLAGADDALTALAEAHADDVVEPTSEPPAAGPVAPEQSAPDTAAALDDAAEDELDVLRPLEAPDFSDIHAALDRLSRALAVPGSVDIADAIQHVNGVSSELEQPQTDGAQQEPQPWSSASQPSSHQPETPAPSPPEGWIPEEWRRTVSSASPRQRRAPARPAMPAPSWPPVPEQVPDESAQEAGQQQGTPQPPRDQPMPPREPAQPVPGVDDALADPFRDAAANIGQHAASQEWRRITEIMEAARHLGRTLLGSAGSYRREVAQDIRIRGFWRTAMARSARTISTCAYQLARGIEKSSSLTVRALRSLARRAADYADRLTGVLPAGRSLQSKSDLEQGWNELDARLDVPARPRAGSPAWTAQLLRSGVEGMRQAWNTAAGNAGAAITSTAAWRAMATVWNGARSVLDKVHQGALAYKRDARDLGLFTAAWTRTCETIAWGTRQALEYLHAKGSNRGAGWQALRLLHHTAEETVAHLRGQLPRGEHAALGTYDPPALAEPDSSHAATRSGLGIDGRVPTGRGHDIEELITMLDTLDYARQHGKLTGPFAHVGQFVEREAAHLGLTRIGEPNELFDPERHDALSVIPDATAPADDPVVGKVMRHGYALGGRVVRPASVAVIQPEEAAEAVQARSLSATCNQLSEVRRALAPRDPKALLGADVRVAPRAPGNLGVKPEAER